MEATKDKVKHIYEALPHLNCGLCGFEGCGQFAKAVAEERASPFGCRQDPGAGYRISRIIGGLVLGAGFNHTLHRGLFAHWPRQSACLQSLRTEVDELLKRLDGLLERMNSLETRDRIAMRGGDGTRRPGRAQVGGRSLVRGGARGRRMRMP